MSAHLPMIANQFVSLLSEQDAASFLSSWLGSKLIVGSLCSGTDVCVDAIQGLAGVGKFVVEHKLSCEISPANQRWILQQCSPPPMVLYEDVYEFAKGYGYDVKNQRVAQLVPCDMLFVGFSCKDLSRLNQNSVNNRSCVRTKSLRTGGTLAGSMSYITAVKPRWVFLENVTAIECVDEDWWTNNADEIVCLFADLGYCMAHCVLDARQHGAAHRRTRWWACAFRMNDSAAITVQQDEAMTPLKDKYLQVLDDIKMKPVSLFQVLMDEDSEDLAAWQKARFAELEELHEKELKQAREHKWPDKHKEIFRAEGLRYPPEFPMIYNQEELRMLTVLPARAQDIVAFYDLKFGRVTEGEEVIDLQASLDRVARAKDAIPCTLPKGIPWARSRFRIVEPNETLACQGLHRKTFEELENFTRNELQSLAGNAFSGNTALACTLAALVAFKDIE